MTLKAYHGSSWSYDNEFTTPSLKYSLYKGLFFISYLPTAQFYALNKAFMGTPIVLEGELTFENHYCLSVLEYDDLMDLYAEGRGNKYYIKMKRLGFDGLIFPDNETGTEIVALSPKSFKTHKIWIYDNGWKIYR